MHAIMMQHLVFKQQQLLKCTNMQSYKASSND
jgi:hypothetical protein